MLKIGRSVLKIDKKFVTHGFLARGDSVTIRDVIRTLGGFLVFFSFLFS